jgi:hypothetical protein
MDNLFGMASTQFQTGENSLADANFLILSHNLCECSGV